MITSSKKNPTQAQQASNRILLGTEMVGDIKTDGDIRIDGKVKGTIDATGKLVVGEKGVVEGEVKCTNATISGLIKGTLQVENLLTMHTSAKVKGDILTGKLSVEPGAEFTGTCSMGAVVRDLKEEDKEKKLAEQTA